MAIGISNPSTIELFDIKGKLVKKTLIEDNGTIPLAEFKRGTYIAKIRSQINGISLKFIKK